MLESQAGKVHEKGPSAAGTKKASRGREAAKPKIEAKDVTTKKAVQEGVKLLKVRFIIPSLFGEHSSF